MNDTVAAAIMVAALVVAAFAGWLAVRNRPVSDLLFYAVAVVELALLGQLVGGVVALAGAHRQVEGATFVGYLLASVLVPPGAVLWGVSDKSRWGTGVIALGLVTEAFLQLRLLQVWAGPNG